MISKALADPTPVTEATAVSFGDGKKFAMAVADIPPMLNVFVPTVNCDCVVLPLATWVNTVALGGPGIAAAACASGRRNAAAKKNPTKRCVRMQHPPLEFAWSVRDFFFLQEQFHFGRGSAERAARPDRTFSRPATFVSIA
jgi:hypothetical protein